MEIRLFCGGVPVQSTISLTEGYFKLAGYLMASSILQGGPAPNFLAKWVYEYISGGLDAVKVQIEDVTTYSIKRIVTRVRNEIVIVNVQNLHLTDLIPKFSVGKMLCSGMIITNNSFCMFEDFNCKF